MPVKLYANWVNVSKEGAVANLSSLPQEVKNRKVSQRL